MSALSKLLPCFIAVAAVSCSAESPVPEAPTDSSPPGWQGSIEARDGVVQVRNPVAG